MRGKSRQTRLLIAFALIAIGTAIVHITTYTPDRHQPGTFHIGSATWVRGPVTYPPNYSQIEDGLWMGGFVDAPPAGTQAVLNVCESKDPYQAESHQWSPIFDGPPPPKLEWLSQQVAFIETQRQAGHGVYVHCHGGVSRSAMVMAAYLMQREGWSREKAIAFLQSKRPAISPNPAFTPLLMEWERSLKTGATISTTQPEKN